MNWIQELLALYENNRDMVGKWESVIPNTKNGEERSPLILLPVFHTTAKAQITVTVDTEGEFVEAEKVKEKDSLTVTPGNEDSLSRTSATAPHALCDSLKYVAGDYTAHYKQEKKKEDFSTCYCAYMEALGKWNASAYTHKKVSAIYRYLQKGTLVQDLADVGVLVLDRQGKIDSSVKIQGQDQKHAFVRFCVDPMEIKSSRALLNQRGESELACWRDESLYQAYIQYYSSTLSDEKLCYLSGNWEPISYKQPKKIRNEADRAKLISSNDDKNYTFRGRFQNKQEAFSVGFETSQKVHCALNWIIRKQGYHWEDFYLVVWESNLQFVPSIHADTDEITMEITEAYKRRMAEDEVPSKPTGEQAAANFRKAMRGYGEMLESKSQIILLGLDSAGTGRLSLVENKVFQSSTLLENLTYWHESCRWQQVKHKDDKTFYYMGMAGVSDIAEAIYGTEQNGRLVINDNNKNKNKNKTLSTLYGTVCKRLLPCISDRRRIPSDLVRLAVQKASAPVCYQKRYNWEAVLGIACGLVKKERMERKQEEWNMALDQKCTNRDYLYGRLLAVADKIERRIFDRDADAGRETNADRLMQMFSQRPYQTWKIIEERIHPYFKKLSVKDRNYYKSQMDEICGLFEVGTFTDNTKLDGVYLLGYHSQMNEMRYKKPDQE